MKAQHHHDSHDVEKYALKEDLPAHPAGTGTKAMSILGVIGFGIVCAAALEVTNMSLFGNLFGNGTTTNADLQQWIQTNEQLNGIQGISERNLAQSVFNAQTLGFQGQIYDEKLNAATAQTQNTVNQAVNGLQIQSLQTQLAEKNQALQTANILAGVGAMITNAVNGINCNTTQAAQGAAGAVINKIDCCCNTIESMLSGNSYVKAATLTIPQTVVTSSGSTTATT